MREREYKSKRQNEEEDQQEERRRVVAPAPHTIILSLPEPTFIIPRLLKKVLLNTDVKVRAAAEEALSAIFTAPTTNSKKTKANLLTLIGIFSLFGVYPYPLC